jgi:hypothetical protein
LRCCKDEKKEVFVSASMTEAACIAARMTEGGVRCC